MIAFAVPSSNYADPEHTPAGPVMFGDVDATTLADPGDEDRRPVFQTWLEMFGFVADHGTGIGGRMLQVLVAEMKHWREREEFKARTLARYGP